MIPAAQHLAGSGGRIPRESGDDPKGLPEPARAVKYSPRERG